MTDQAPAHAARRPRRWRWIAAAVLAILTLPVLAGAAALLALRTEAGQAFAARLVERVASSGEIGIAVGGIGGALPGALDVTDLVVSDRDGPAITLDRARLAWSPLDLLRGRLTIDALTIGTLTVARAPRAPGGPGAEPGAPAGLPQLPIGVEIRQAGIDRLDLGGALLGGPGSPLAAGATLTLSASARLIDPAEHARLRLDAERLDGVGGTLSLTAGLDPASGRITLDGTVTEPEGGLVSGLLAMPDRPAVRVMLAGAGTLDGFAADLTARAGAADLEARFALSRDQAGRLAGQLTASLAPGPLLPPDLAPLAGGRIEVMVMADRDPVGSIRLDLLEVMTRATTLRAEGAIDLPGQRVDLGWSLSPVAFDAVAPYLGGTGLGFRDVAAQGTATGTFQAPRLAVTVTATAPMAPGLAGDRLTAELRADRTDAGAGLDLAARLDAPRSDAEALDALLADTVTLSAAGAWLSRDRLIRLDDAVLDAGPAVLAASGRVGLTGVIQTQGRLTVPALAAVLRPVGAPVVDGPLDVPLTVARAADGRLDATLSTRSGGLTWTLPVAARLAGPTPELDVTLTRTPDGAIALDGLRLAGAGLTVMGAADLTPAGVLSGSADLDLRRLADLSPAVTGGLELRAGLGGTLAAPAATVTARARDLTVAGQPAALDATVTGTDLTGDARMTVTAGGRLAGADLALDTVIARRDGAIQVRDLVLAGLGTRIAGDAAIDAAGLVTGGLTVAAPDLAPIGRLAGLGLAGAGTATVRLAPDQGRQSALASARIDALAVDGTAQVTRIDLSAEAADLLGTPSGRLDLVADRARAAGLAFDRLRVDLSGDAGRVDIALRAEGAPLDLVGDARVTLGDGQTVRLARLDGTYLGEAFRLAAPATVRRRGQTVSLDGLRIQGTEGEVALNGRATPAELALSARLVRLPLRLAALAAPDLALAGTLDGMVEVTGTPDAPRAAVTLAARQIGTPQAQAAGVPAASLDLDARFGAGRLDLDARADFQAAGQMTLAGRATLPQGPLAAIAEAAATAPLQGRLDGRIDLAMLDAILAGSGQRLDGAIDIAVALAGTTAAPALSGQVAGAGLRYANLVHGVHLDPISALVRFDGDRAEIARLEAETPASGRLSASGTVGLDMATGLPADLRLFATRALLAETDVILAPVDADLTVTGPLLTAPVVRGRITQQGVEIRIPDRLPASVPTLEVVELNGGPGQGPPTAPPPSAPPPDVTLDLEVVTGRPILVSGQGLDAEIEGDLRITGPAADPAVAGALSLRRGQLDILSQRFTLDRGTIEFPGGPLDPRLDFLAATPVGDLTALITITGPAAAPMIMLSSEPEAPEDEVLSRLLFGRATTQLTPGELTRLGLATAELAGFGGGGPGVTDRIRRRLALDRLSVSPGGAAGATLEAGRQINDQVFVGVRQGLDAQSTRVTVEVEVLDNLNLESDLGADQTGRLGATYSIDY